MHFNTMPSTVLPLVTRGVHFIAIQPSKAHRKKAHSHAQGQLRS